jgi:hypothetical protein
LLHSNLVYNDKLDIRKFDIKNILEKLITIIDQ